MKNDKSNSKEEESPSEGARGERLDFIADRLTKIEEMLEELIRDAQRSRKSQQISSETYAGAGIRIAFGIFVLSFAITIIPLKLLLSFLLFYGAGFLVIILGFLSIIGTNYTLKREF